MNDFTKRFLDWNKRVSRSIAKIFPHTKYGNEYISALNLYYQMLGKYFGYMKTDKLSDSLPGKVVLDVGCGRTCGFQEESFRKEAFVVAVDISAEELSYNQHADFKIQADITREIPYPESVGRPEILCSAFVMEHLENNDSFIGLSAEVLAGGYFIALLPNKFAPFSMINQLLGHRAGSYILRVLGKKTEGNGFKAYYDHTEPSAIRKLLEVHGYRVVEQRLLYGSSDYFDFCFPAYFLSRFYECIVERLGVEALCSYFIVAAQKTGL